LFNQSDFFFYKKKATFWGHEEVASILKESQKESPLLFQQNVVHFFSGNSLNRSGNQRKQKDWATKLMTDMSTTYIVFSGSKCLFQSIIFIYLFTFYLKSQFSFFIFFRRISDCFITL